MTALSHALTLAEQGYPVFPARPSKAPYTEHGLHDASTDPDQIRAWWRQWPDALVAVPTGTASGLLVVDIDPAGAEWYADHADRLACGRIHRTRRGHHLVYRYPDAEVRNSASRIAPGVDVRGQGGYLVWWPAHGHETVGDLDDIGEVPGWLLDLLKEKPRQAASEPGGDAIPEGRRNDDLSREAFRLRRQGASVEDIITVLAAINTARCNPPLGDDEIEAIARGKARVEPEDTATWPRPIDLHALSEIEPQPPRMLIDDWLPAGYATLLAGHGGVGKSGIALHLSCCLALGRPWWGLPVRRSSVLYLSCEDREPVVHWRLSRICRQMGITLADLAGDLDILDLVGRETILWERVPGGTTYTAGFAELVARAHAADVLVVDGISDTFGGNENARCDVKSFVSRLLSLIHENRGALILIGHVAKPAASGAVSEGYSGSTGWHNSVRARWYLRPEIEQTEDGDEKTGNLVLELQKSNLGSTDHALRFRWDQGAHLFTGEPISGKSEFDRRAQETEERDGILAALRGLVADGDYCPAATTGRRTAHHVLSARPELPESLRGKPNTRRFWRHIEHLRSMRAVREGEIRRADRKITVTLEPADTTYTSVCANAANANQGNGSAMAAEPPAANAANAAGGYRGAGAHTEAPDWPTSYASIRG